MLCNLLMELNFISGVHIKSIDHAILINKVESKRDSYFCIKMTVVVEIEGLSAKKQDIEERFVLIKAKSFEEAYEKLEQKKDTYAQPYLNPNGRFVRWRIESFDDCYETDIIELEDVDSPEGVEVYSQLKSRKSKAGTFWDGRSK